MSGTIPKRRTCHASCPRALEWYLERYVHRDNVHALWAWQTRHYWCDIKTWNTQSVAFKPTFIQDLSSFLYPDNGTELTGHKKESKGRKADRESIKRKLQECIDPMNPEGHPSEVVNIAIGQIAQDNVDKAVELGSKQMKEFENGWPKTLMPNLTLKWSHKLNPESISKSVTPRCLIQSSFTQE